MEPENKSGLIDEPVSDLEDDITKREVMGTPRHYSNQSPAHGMMRYNPQFSSQYDYDDSDSIGKPSYDSSDVTEGTEYSHLRDRETGYSHLDTPDSSTDHATFV